MPKVSIGIVSTMILVTVFILGWLLKGPIGVGTVIAVALQGNIMQMAFNIMKFEPKDVVHQDLLQSFKVIFKK